MTEKNDEIQATSMADRDDGNPVLKKNCKYCDAAMSIRARVCNTCNRDERWYLNYFRIGDVILLVSVLVSFGMVVFSYLNFHEAREERVKASEALKIASKAEAIVTQADQELQKLKSSNEESKNEVIKLKSLVQDAEGKLIKIEDTTKDLNKIVKEVSLETKSAKVDLKDVSEETATLRVYYDVRRGERAALNNLIRLAKEDSSRKGKLAKSLLDDSNLYFKDYKYSLTQQFVINLKTRKPTRPQAEGIYIRMYKDKNPLQREAEINEIAKRKLIFFVQDLVKVTKDDSNLKVACRAAKAIEDLTEEHFEDYPPYDEVQRWWDKTGSKEKKYSNNLHLLGEAETLLTKKEFDKALSLLENISNSRSGMCQTHFNISKIYFERGDREKTKQHLKIAIEECDAQIEAMALYGHLLYQEGKKEEVIDLLSKMKPYLDDQVLFEKRCRTIFPNLVNEEKFKKLFGSK